jgi:hypothetical protein
MPDGGDGLTPGPLPLAWLVIGGMSAGVAAVTYHETGFVSGAIIAGLTTAGALYALLRHSLR